MRHLLIASLVVVALCLQASAICPRPEPRPCNLFHISKAVFVGTVRSERQIQAGKDDDGGTEYTLLVHRQFRGARTRTVKVYTANDSGREVLEVGKTYMVFAQKGSTAHPLQIWCLFTREVADVEAAARALETVRRDEGDATLRGEVWADEAGGPLPSAAVTIRGPKGKLNLHTDKEGRFQLKVESGHYSVRVRAPDGRPMSQSDYNQFAIDAADFFLRRGQCADLRFVVRQ